MDWYNKVKEFVDESFKKSGNTQGLPHFERTVYWLKQLKPDADEAMQIAAYAHDVERAFRPKGKEAASLSNKGFRDDFYLKYHPQKGAEVISDFLLSNQAPSQVVGKIASLIAKHEVGGNDDQNLIKDADSISYFENQVNHFISNKAGEVGKPNVEQKFKWMFDRMTSQRAKDIARPLYEAAIKKLYQ
jgi:Domain of unknown function (DUF4202)